MAGARRKRVAQLHTTRDTSRESVMAMNIVTGNDGANALSGTAGSDLIYGFDPNAPYASATISATRVASGLNQPLYVTADPRDPSRLFIVEKTGTIKFLDLNTNTVLPRRRPLAQRQR